MCEESKGTPYIMPVQRNLVRKVCRWHAIQTQNEAAVATLFRSLTLVRLIASMLFPPLHVLLSTAYLAAASSATSYYQPSFSSQQLQPLKSGRARIFSQR